MLKIKTYPHFDPILTLDEAEELVSDPARVSTHAFFPFIQYSERWTKFALKGGRGKTKSRPIMYASRRDSCIYSRYRSLLNEAYEREIAKRGIVKSVLAYRRIPRETSKGNKSNIHFAADTFAEISELGNCTVYTLDISKFFESLSHSRLKREWIRVMGFYTMPLDHYQVFRSITRHASVRREELYRTLGFIGVKSRGARPVIGYLVKRVPLQVCPAKVFREKIASLIETNQHNYGIPQGSPISDVLANLYMLEFDTQLAKEASDLGGSYRRYSDDIIFIVPGKDDDPVSRITSIETLLQLCGDNLQIQPTKSTVHQFSKSGETGVQTCQLLRGSSGKNGLEYLGFRFDGRHVFIRDSTRSRLQRKMTFAVRASVRKLHRANPGMGRAELKSIFDPNSVLRQFYKVRDFETVVRLPRRWTFWTYVVRAQQAFGQSGSTILAQLRRFRKSISYRAGKLIDECTNRP